MKKMAKIGQKWQKLDQKWPKMVIFIDFWTFFQNLITLQIFFSQTSLTTEMKDLKSLFHIKVTYVKVCERTNCRKNGSHKLQATVCSGRQNLDIQKTVSTNGSLRFA